MPDGDGVVGGEIDHRLCGEETEDLALRGVFGAEQLLVDLDELETRVDLSIHFSCS